VYARSLRLLLSPFFSPVCKCCITHEYGYIYATLLISQEVRSPTQKEAGTNKVQIHSPRGKEFGTDDDPPGLKKRDSKL
jgi:hypothetical protein